MEIKMRLCDICGNQIPRSNIFLLADFSYIRNADNKYLGENASYEMCVECFYKMKESVEVLKHGKKA